MFCVATWVIAAAVTAFSFGIWRQSEVLDSAGITAGEGYSSSYRLRAGFVPAGIFGRQADRNQTPGASNLVLFENGKRSGVPHSFHDEIKRIGAGRYSHWTSGGPLSSTDIIVFSTADSSDPRTNGRVYSVEYAAEPGSVTVALVAALCVISIVGLYRASFNDPSVRGARVRKAMAAAGHTVLQGHVWTTLVFVVAGYVVAYYAVRMPAVPLLLPDSRMYLTAHPLVPLGYLSFASTVSWAGGSLKALPAAQISVWAASVLALYFALCEATRFRFVAALAAIGLLLLGTVTRFAMIALTETVFASVLALHVAAVLFALDYPTKTRLLMVGLTAVLAVFIRPAGLFVAVCTLALLLLLPRSRRSLLWFCVLPMIAMYLLAGAASYAYRGGDGQSLLPLALFPHVCHLFKAEYVPEMHPAAEAVEQSLASYRTELSAKHGARERARFEMENFNRASFAAEFALRDFGVKYREEAIPYFRTFAWATIRRRPSDYAAHVVDHVIFAWANMLFYRIDTAAWLREHYAAFGQTHNLAAQEVAEHFAVPQYQSSDLVTGRRSLAHSSAAVDYVPNLLASMAWLGPIMGVVSAIVVIAGLLWGVNIPTLLALAYIGALMHSAIFLVAGTTTVIPRYIDPVAPLAIIFLALLLDASLAWLRRCAARPALR